MLRPSGSSDSIAASRGFEKHDPKGFEMEYPNYKKRNVGIVLGAMVGPWWGHFGAMVNMLCCYKSTSQAFVILSQPMTPHASQRPRLTPHKKCFMSSTIRVTDSEHASGMTLFRIGFHCVTMDLLTSMVWLPTNKSSSFFHPCKSSHLKSCNTSCQSTYL